MAQKTRNDLKTYFQTGDKLSSRAFIDLIDSLVSTREDSSVSGSILPSLKDKFNLGSKSFPWKEVFVSTGSINFVKPDGTVTTFSESDISASKLLESQRKSTDGLPVKKLRSFTSASTFIDLESSQSSAGDRIDIKVANTFEAFSVSTVRTSIGPKETVPLELTGSLKVKQSQTDPHEFLGKYQFKGNPGNFGNAGKGVEFLNDVGFKYSGSKDIVEFKPEGGVSFTGGNVVMEDAVISQAGVISQSINIGTSTSPSIAEYIGVHDNYRITVAPGVTVNVHPGSKLIIKPQQPNIAADPSTGDIVVSAVDGGDISFNIGEFGTNPQYIPIHMTIPAGNQAIWYGPIFIGRFSNQIGQVLNLDSAGQGQNASLRINEGANIRIQAF
jgi:hypothetical protein